MQDFFDHTLGLPVTGVIFLLIFVFSGRYFMTQFTKQPRQIFSLVVSACLCITALLPLVLWDFRG